MEDLNFESGPIKKQFNSASNRFNTASIQPPINANSKRIASRKKPEYDDFYESNSFTKSRKKGKSGGNFIFN